MSDIPRPPVCWKLERWPEADRASWQRNTTPGDPFDDPRHGASLRPASLGKISKCPSTNILNPWNRLCFPSPRDDSRGVIDVD